ncbi:beta-1,2-xylosyltransferase RCN11 isoform X2 [Aplysia californica]|uniref:EGF domain-specific O-linked N-acetylglucosamine transferase n=1 Tax=Aplysia californica TaxID=6500 RepID=A0ABM0JNI3_APLCA|nr:beta-1,2-xylosyltransferase RCN11 isoform X2 [Aplysia californica]
MFMATSRCFPTKGRRPFTCFLPRRLRSCQCVVLGVAAINVIIFVTVFQGTAPRRAAGDGSAQIRGLLDAGDYAVSSRLTAGQTKYRNRLIVDNAAERRFTGEISEKTLCGYRTTSYIFNIPITLNQDPFEEYAKSMQCLADDNAALFSGMFAAFRNAVIDPSLGTSKRKGGELMDEVWDQKESDEYFHLSSGYFKIPCRRKPKMYFKNKDHLVQWANSLECYFDNPPTDITIRDFTLAIQRYEYVNLYHTMTDFYNAFVLMLLFGVRPSKMNILFVDTHPKGHLDTVWSTLFGKIIRAGHLNKPVLFHSLGWGMLGYFSPLNEHSRKAVPYLEEFREFFLTQHNVSTSHQLDCKKVNVLFIWRRDYVAHPRNKQGSVVRKFANEEEMLEQTQKTLGGTANVQGFQLDLMSMKDQLEVVSKCDILVGMHGAGLSHTLFLPPTSGVLELKPQYSPSSLLHFEAMARWRQLPFSLWHNTESSNEQKEHRTYIPPLDLDEEVKKIYSKICGTG